MRKKHWIEKFLIKTFKNFERGAVQVNLTNNMTKDCLLIYQFSTWKLQAQNMYKIYFLLWHLEQFMCTTCSELVVFMYWTGKPMNNRLSYCGLLDVRTDVSDKDLPVQITEKITTNWQIPIWSEFLRRIKLRRLFQPWQPFTQFALHLSKAMEAVSSGYFRSSAQIKVIKLSMSFGFMVQVKEVFRHGVNTLV